VNKLPVGQGLRNARLHVGLKQAEVCRRGGFRKAQVSSWEGGGGVPNLESFCGLSEAMGIEPWKLLRHICKLRKIKAAQDAAVAA
jgi:transcriptional regulator with XRE-family HTH domain